MRYSRRHNDRMTWLLSASVLVLLSTSSITVLESTTASNGWIPTVSAFSTSVPRFASFRGSKRSSSSSSLFGNRQTLTRIHPTKLTRPSSPARSSASLMMHMGHSHSHHHHHDHDDHDNGLIESKIDKAKRRRRRLAMFIFAAMAILGPPTLIKKRALTNADGAAFMITGLLISSADKIRSEARRMLLKIQKLKDGFVKHATPAMTTNPIDYFTSNEELTKEQKEHTAADRVTVLGVVVNLLLSSGKFFVGLTCHSSALLADAGHSLSDLFSDFVTLYSVQLARLPPDDDHPYGHGKFEAIGSLFLALTLIGTGISVGAMANKELLKIWSASRAASTTAAAIAIPKPPALLMAGISIISKEWLYRITKRVGDKLNSQVVIANAWHHRSDAYSSVLALLSIGLAIAVPGMVAADALAGILVAGMIGMTGIDILSESIQQLSDTTSAEWIRKVEKIVTQEVSAADDDVVNVTRIRARPVGSSSLVDVRITTPSRLSTSATRAVEERVRRHLLNRLQGQVLDAEVHATPVTSATSTTNGKSTTQAGPGAATSSGAPGSEEDKLRNLDGSIVCPLLAEQKQQNSPTTKTAAAAEGENDNEDAPSVLNMPPSASEIEREVRQISLMVQHSHTPAEQQPAEKEGSSPQHKHPFETHSVTVHYLDTMNISIDVDLKMEMQADNSVASPSMKTAGEYSLILKRALEDYYYSNSATMNYNVKAKIFLDLSSVAESPSSPNDGADGRTGPAVPPPIVVDPATPAMAKAVSSALLLQKNFTASARRP